MRQQPKLTRYDLPEACRAVLDAAPPTITPAARQQLDASTRAAVAACEARAILSLGRRLNAVAETYLSKAVKAVCTAEGLTLPADTVASLVAMDSAAVKCSRRVVFREISVRFISHTS